MTYTYYRYLDKFHCIPKDIQDLFEFMDYNETISKIDILTGNVGAQ